MEPIITVIMERRKQAGLSQDKVAKLAGMSTKTYQRIERGESDLKLSQYRAILRSLGMTHLDVAMDELSVRKIESDDLISAVRLLDKESKLLLIRFILQLSKSFKTT
ncbi:XRE family transcriptional regulator [Vibrio aquaticus]|uniref:XRE family transcriptional regulator n=1 Tax=Vibrio aquaticus TaxID=2496559 RepID=A0A3S0Q3H8_9VIBR|nr:helix-turn-helix transcriptional regulator [Vibrio aquaticus]RTZ17736.1 XRE family transcriptional regulator [Vibrio aquaticus]